MSLEELRQKREKLKANSEANLHNMKTIADESCRVADVAHNSQKILEDLDREFEQATGLQGNDILFLFAATGLQIARIVILNELKTRLNDFPEKLLEGFCSGYVEERAYYDSVGNIISRARVPYDAIAPLYNRGSMDSLLKENSTGEFAFADMLPAEEMPRRFSTLGNDPILGLIFGTANIMTNTITSVKTLEIAGGIPIPLLSTNHVAYSSDFTDPRIAAQASTVAMLRNTIQRIEEEPGALVAALIKQIVHIGTDLYTHCGIQIPSANLVLSNSNVEGLVKFIYTGDVVKIAASAGLAGVINTIISTLHMLMYDPDSEYSRDIYNVRTRKIIMYSNTIASASNVIWVGGNMLQGNGGAIRQLDIGGLMVTIKRLLTDKAYIAEIKKEFVFEGFNKMIQGDELGLEEISWD